MTAETFTVAWRRAADLPPGAEARLWLYGVAPRVLANHRRGERLEPTVTTSRVDALVAGLAGVDGDRLPGPSTPGAGELLTAITAEERPAAPTGRPSRRYGRLAIGVVAVAAVSAVVALNTGGPGPIRGYAAVDIRRTDGTYKVHVKNVYADQRQFRQAFAEFGLDVRCRSSRSLPATSARSWAAEMTGRTEPAGSSPSWTARAPRPPRAR